MLSFGIIDRSFYRVLWPCVDRATKKLRSTLIKSLKGSLESVTKFVKISDYISKTFHPLRVLDIGLSYEIGHDSS